MDDRRPSSLRDGAERVRQTSLIHARPHANTFPNYGAVLVEAAARRGADELVHCASRLANMFGAGLLGLTTPAMIQRRMDIPDGQHVSLDQAVRSEMDAVGKQFCKWTETVHAGVSWRALRTSFETAMALEAHAADLIVASQTLDSRARRSPALAAAILASGRPFLVVPPGCAQFEARNVILCWNDSRECRRAMLDATPFLVRASNVIVLAISFEADPVRMTVRLDEVAAGLKRRGVPAIARVSRLCQPSLSATVNVMAEAYGADLVAAGAYGHGALHRSLFGSATDGLLTQSRTALLLSR